MECRPSPASPTVRALPLRGPESQRRSPVQPPWRSSAKAPARLRTSAGGREACNPRGVPAPRARGRWDGWAGRDARGSRLGAGRRGAATLGSRAALAPSGGGAEIAGAYLVQRGWETPGGAAAQDLSDHRPHPQPDRGKGSGPSRHWDRQVGGGGGGGLEVLDLGVPHNHRWSLFKGKKDTQV